MYGIRKKKPNYVLELKENVRRGCKNSLEIRRVKKRDGRKHLPSVSTEGGR
jgi:hypothetical protein